MLLPIWHNITKQDVVNFSPSLADKVARSTAVVTIEEIADEIVFLLEGNIYFKGTINELKTQTQQPDFEHAIAAILNKNNHA